MTQSRHNPRNPAPAYPGEVNSAADTPVGPDRLEDAPDAPDMGSVGVDRTGTVSGTPGGASYLGEPRGSEASAGGGLQDLPAGGGTEIPSPDVPPDITPSRR